MPAERRPPVITATRAVRGWRVAVSAPRSRAAPAEHTTAQDAAEAMLDAIDAALEAGSEPVGGASEPGRKRRR